MRVPFRKNARLATRTLVASAFIACAASAASAATLNFDSIATPHCGTVAIDPIPSGFGGFTWDSNLAVECDTDYMGGGGSANSYGAPSPANAIYNQAGTASITITRGADFQFDGAMFSGWTLGDLVDLIDNVTAQSVTVKGYLGGAGGTLVGTGNLTLAGADGSGALGYLALGGITGSIDTLVISTPVTNGSLGNFWLMDNFQYEDVTNGGGPSAVPEPASILLLGTGLAGALARARRKKTTN